MAVFGSVEFIIFSNDLDEGRYLSFRVDVKVGKHNSYVKRKNLKMC